MSYQIMQRTELVPQIVRINRCKYCENTFSIAMAETVSKCGYNQKLFIWKRGILMLEKQSNV